MNKNRYAQKEKLYSASQVPAVTLKIEFTRQNDP